MTTHARDARPAVLIFRKILLPWSETFIAAQGSSLERYRPVFAGYTHGAGAAYIGGKDSVVLGDWAASLPIAKGMLKALGILPARWMRELRAREPVLVHAHFGSNALDASRLARALRVPLIVTYHGSDISKQPRRRRDLRKRHRAFAAAARVLAVSEFIAEQLRVNGCPPDKITLHHIGVDTRKFAPAEAALAGHSQRILFVGRMVGKKGGIHLIRAMPEVQRRVPGAELILAGDGALRGALEAEAKRVGANAIFLGVQPPERIRELMRSSALLCAPSVVTHAGDAEGLPMTVIEAQACGCPVVASPSGGTAEGIAEGESGFVTPAGDEEQLAIRLGQILADPELRARLAAGARRNALLHFDLARQTAKLEEIYDEVRGEAARG